MIHLLVTPLLPLGKKPKGDCNDRMQNIAEGLRRPERLWFNFFIA